MLETEFNTHLHASGSLSRAGVLLQHRMKEACVITYKSRWVWGTVAGLNHLDQFVERGFGKNNVSWLLVLPMHIHLETGGNALKWMPCTKCSFMNCVRNMYHKRTEFVTQIITILQIILNHGWTTKIFARLLNRTTHSFPKILYTWWAVLYWFCFCH